MPTGYRIDMTSVVGILKYGCGNIRSVKNALEKIGVSRVKIIESESDLSSAKKIIFPGVGAFDSTCVALKKKNLFKPLQRYLSDKTNKVLGICLGMQVLCISSEEGTETGLGAVDASVNILNSKKGRIKVPHMGWNTVTFVRDDPILEGLGKEQNFYFVHSYRWIMDLSTDVMQTSRMMV